MRLDAKRMSDFRDDGHSRIGDRALDLRNIGAVHPSAIRKLFLRPDFVLPEFAHVFRDRFPYVHAGICRGLQSMGLQRMTLKLLTKS